MWDWNSYPAAQPMIKESTCGWQYSRLQVGLRSLALYGAEHDILVWVPVQACTQVNRGSLVGNSHRWAHCMYT